MYIKVVFLNFYIDTVILIFYLTIFFYTDLLVMKENTIDPPVF